MNGSDEHSGRGAAPERGNVLRTRVAHAGWDDYRYRGHALYGELLGRETFSSLLVMAVGGPRIAPELHSLLDDICVIVTAADPRIFPLKVTRLVSSYGGMTGGLVAGLLCADRAFIGPWALGRSGEFLIEAERQCSAAEVRAEAVEEIARGLLDRSRRVSGFGVVNRERDERLDALIGRIEHHGRQNLRYWRLMTEIARVTIPGGLQPNIALGLAAASLDLGLSPGLMAPLHMVVSQGAFLANAVEGAEQQPALLREIPPGWVDDRSRSPRRSPRADRPPVAT